MTHAQVSACLSRRHHTSDQPPGAPTADARLRRCGCTASPAGSARAGAQRARSLSLPACASPPCHSRATTRSDGTRRRRCGKRWRRACTSTRPRRGRRPTRRGGPVPSAAARSYVGFFVFFDFSGPARAPYGFIYIFSFAAAQSPRRYSRHSRRVRGPLVRSGTAGPRGVSGQESNLNESAQAFSRVLGSRPRSPPLAGTARRCSRPRSRCSAAAARAPAAA